MGDSPVVHLATARIAAVSLVLVAPLALAGSMSWTDPTGDATISFAFGAGVPLLCEDPRVDITAVTIDSTDEAVVFTLTALDLAASPSCDLDGPVPLTLTPSAGQRNAAFNFGEPFFEPYFFIDDAFNNGGRCFSEFEIDGFFAQPDCTYDVTGNTVTMSISTLVDWVYDSNTETIVEDFDIRMLDLPPGVANMWTHDSFGTVTAHVSDTVDLGVVDLS